MSNTVSNWKLIISYVLIFALGLIVGKDLLSDRLKFENLSAWFGAISTFLAVVVALYTARININRDSYKLKCTYKLQFLPVPREIDGFVVGVYPNIMKKLTIRTVNLGLRPIAIDSVAIKNTNLNINKIKITDERDKNGFPQPCVLQPGEFREWEVPHQYYPETEQDIDACSFYVVDAAEIRHLAIKK